MRGELTSMAIVAISLSMIPHVASLAHEKSLTLRSTSGVSSRAYYDLDTFPKWFLDGVLPKDESCNFILQRNPDGEGKSEKNFIFPVCRHGPNLYDSWITADPEPEREWAGKTVGPKGASTKPPVAAPPASIGDSLRDAWGKSLYLIETTAFKGDITPSLKYATEVVQQGTVSKIDWGRLAQEEVKKYSANVDELAKIVQDLEKHVRYIDTDTNQEARRIVPNPYFCGPRRRAPLTYEDDEDCKKCCVYAYVFPLEGLPLNRNDCQECADGTK